MVKQYIAAEEMLFHLRNGLRTKHIFFELKHFLWFFNNKLDFSILNTYLF